MSKIRHQHRYQTVCNITYVRTQKSMVQSADFVKLKASWRRWPIIVLFFIFCTNTAFQVKFLSCKTRKNCTMKLFFILSPSLHKCYQYPMWWQGFIELMKMLLYGWPLWHMLLKQYLSCPPHFCPVLLLYGFGSYNIIF